MDKNDAQAQVDDLERRVGQKSAEMEDLVAKRDWEQKSYDQF